MKNRSFRMLFAAVVIGALTLNSLLPVLAGEAGEEGEAVLEEMEETAGAEDISEEAALEDEEDYTTGDASKDDPKNQDGIGEKEILVVSFGTSFNDSRRETIGAIENDIEEAFPDWSVRRAFTAQIIIDHIERRDGIHIDNVKEALDRACENGVRTLVVQPTHLMAGFEYAELEETLAEYADAMDIYLGANLLDTDENLALVEQAVTEATKEFDDGQTAIIFMGHGTEADSNGIYAKMQEVLTQDGKDNYYIGTVEADPSLEDVMSAIEEKGYTKVILRPLMVVAGDHAHNDMASEDDPESWYSVLTSAGYEVTSVLEGLGQLPQVRQIYVDHVRETLETNGLED